MSNDSNETLDPQALSEKFDVTLHKVVHMRKTYPGSCASYLSSALYNDVDMMMKAEVVPDEIIREVYSPQYTDNTKMEKLNLYAELEPFPNKSEELSKQILDIRDALNQIRGARHKNVQH